MKKSSILLTALVSVLALPAVLLAEDKLIVQDSTGTTNVIALTNTGDINSSGNIAIQSTAGKIAIGLSSAPLGTASPISGPAGALHVSNESNVASNSSILLQMSTRPTAAGGSTFGPNISPTISFYRINRYDSTNPTSPLAYVLPLVDNALGYFQFGTINSATDANLGSSRKNVAVFFVKAEKNWTSLTDTATYFSWQNTAVGGGYTEKMRLSSAGNLGIGTTGTPTSKLQVVGLVTSDSGPPAGMTSGAFYKTSSNVVMVVP